jgi:WD40 repeat protein
LQFDTGKELRSFAGHKHALLALAFSPDGRTLASGSGDGTVRFWDPATGEELSAARGHEESMTCVALAPDGQAVVTGSGDSTLRFWDPATGRELRRRDFADYDLGLPRKETVRMHNPRALYAVAFSPDGSLLAVGGYQVCQLIDPRTGKRKVAINLPVEDVNLSGLVYSPDGKRMASAAGSRVRLWDTATGKRAGELPAHKGFVRSVAFSPDGKLLATSSYDRTGKIRLWEVATGKLVREILARKDTLYGLAFAPDGRALAAGTGNSRRYEEENTIQVWDPATGQELAVFRGHFPTAGNVAYSPDGRTLAATAYTEVYLWETATGQVRACFTGQAGAVEGMAFAPDGRSLVTAHRDSTALVWDLTGGRRTPRPLTQAARQAAWEDLAGAEAERAYRAVWALAADPLTAAALRQRLRPVAPADMAQIDRLVADLSSGRFAERERARAALEKLGELAEPALRQALDRNPPLEIRRRLGPLLERLTKPSPERLRELRALEALGHSDTPEARRLLEELAAGAPLVPLTRDARALLDRRGKRVIATP